MLKIILRKKKVLLKLLKSLIKTEKSKEANSFRKPVLKKYDLFKIYFIIIH